MINTDDMSANKKPALCGFCETVDYTVLHHFTLPASQILS
jgi:hypothetical protein